MAKRSRDPEGRRSTILLAAGELIREIGVSAVTHRKVAEKAQVPLGSTTQYFASLTDLIAEALTGLTADVQARLDQVAEELMAAEDVASVLADLVESTVADSTLVRNELSFVLLHTTHPKLKRYIRSDDEVVRQALTQLSSREQADAVIVHIHGLMLYSALLNRRVPRAEMEESFRRLLGQTPAQPAGEP